MPSQDLGVITSAAQRATGGSHPRTSSGPLFRPSTHPVTLISSLLLRARPLQTELFVVSFIGLWAGLIGFLVQALRER